MGVLSLQNLDKCANKTSPKSCRKIFHFYIPGRLPAALYTHVTSVECVKAGTPSLGKEATEGESRY